MRQHVDGLHAGAFVFRNRVICGDGGVCECMELLCS